MAPVSMNFGPQNRGAVPRMSVRDKGAARRSNIILIFQRVLIFEQSVNHRRGPRSWPQIGAAATWLLTVKPIDHVMQYRGFAEGAKGENCR